MKSKSILTAGIAALLGQTSTFAQAELLKLQATKYHDRSKGRGRTTPSKNYLKGSIYTQKSGPYNTNQEQSRRLRQLAKVQS